MSNSLARPVRVTTRSGWWAFTDLLKNRQPFTTSGALSGGTPTGSTGRLPADWRNLYQTGADFVVYSYATPIAWHRPADDLWIVPDERYSVTTSRHQSLIGTAVAQLSAPPAPEPECEHIWSVRLSLPTKLMGAVTGWTEYEECSHCGKRRMRVARNESATGGCVLCRRIGHPMTEPCLP